MKINGITSNIKINLYNKKRKTEVQNKNKAVSKDKIEISQLGKSLSQFSLQDEFILDKEKINSIKEKINNDKYDVNSRDIAKSLLETINRKEK